MDLQGDADFRGLGVELVSISPDPPEAWADVVAEYEIRTPALSDAANRVADRYGVMRWRVPRGADVDAAEPGHTFVLVDEGGRVAWVRDYGAPEHGGLMYVEPADLVRAIEGRLGG